MRHINKTKGLNFRFQQPIKPYFVDFACMKAKLVIELDGTSHDTRQTYDQQRDDYIRKQGYTVLRLTNDDLKDSLAGVVDTIVSKAETMLLELEKKSPA